MRIRSTYSVATLLVVVVIVAGVTGYFLNARRLRDAEAELQVLRRQTGYLRVDDPTQFHAVAVETDEPNTWRWRVFLPKGYRYAWRIAAKDIPQNTVPKRRNERLLE